MGATKVDAKGAREIAKRRAITEYELAAATCAGGERSVTTNGTADVGLTIGAVPDGIRGGAVI